MGGERKPWRSRTSVQPGGRAPAPGALALVQAFVNTHYDLEHEHGAELLASSAALRVWLTERGLIGADVEVDDRDLGRALAVRRALGALAHANADRPGALRAAHAQLNRAAVGAAVEIRFAADGPHFVASPDAGVGGALGVLLAIAAEAQIDGSWYRLKVCPGTDCGWVFYDHSRNQAGRWCSMSVCGGRSKARTHYRRRRAGVG
jgi:predicted RNA-binding Zn ribbon-like protein